MKIIDLLNKIANGEEVPEKFRFAGQIFEKRGSYIGDEDGDSIFDSMCTDFSNINEEIEIIEEDKKIEKEDEILTIDDLECPITYNEMKIWKQVIKEHNKINEIIRFLRKTEKDK